MTNPAKTANRICKELTSIRRKKENNKISKLNKMIKSNSKIRIKTIIINKRIITNKITMREKMIRTKKKKISRATPVKIEITCFL